MKYILKSILLLIISFNVLNAANEKQLRIEPEELNNNINSYKILDTRAHDLFVEDHIQGALNLPISSTYDNAKKDGRITQPIKMQQIIRDLGLHIDDKIVVYDNGSFFDASRLFWTLEVYGFKNVILLNAGYPFWITSHYKVSSEVTVPQTSNYIASINFKRLATKFTTQLATRNPNQIIIDARGDDAYYGKISTAKRFGHVPTAINLAASHNINYDSNNNNKLKNINDLKTLYKDISKDKKVVIYCAVGRISSTNYFALRELGYDVSNYDASWKEWGNDITLPITKREVK